MFLAQYSLGNYGKIFKEGEIYKIVYKDVDCVIIYKIGSKIEGVKIQYLLLIQLQLAVKYYIVENTDLSKYIQCIFNREEFNVILVNIKHYE